MMAFEVPAGVDAGTNGTIGAVLGEAARRLERAGEAPRLEAEILLAHALDRPRAWLLAHGREALDARAAERFQRLLEARLDGQPIAYLIGSREFWSRRFRVTPAVLIPRPETEHLVEAALEKLDAGQRDGGVCRVADLGTGSGVVAVTLGLERPRWRILAIDIDVDALAVARDNALRLGAANVEFRQADWLAGLDGESFDLIASNPPYIAADDPHLGMGDARFEPRRALAANDNGLADLRAIAAQARAHLRAGGWLALEHGYDQAAAVAGLLSEYGYAAIENRTDLAGHVRITLGKLAS